jgi:RNA polymerase sigma factor (sigma-70 family)
MSEDSELLARYRASGDQEAFAELVQRYVDLVWSVGFRKTGDRDLAQDVAQTVFSDLARKAGQFSLQVSLAGWLYRAACYASSRVARDNARRQARERESYQMQSQQLPDQPDESDVAEFLPILDEAISTLGEADRETILLRFFRKRSLAEVGAALGVSEDAAQKRVARAVDRLRHYFQKRGLGTSTTALVVVLGAAGSQAAPVGLATTLAASSVAALATTGTGSAWLATASSLSTMKLPLTITALVAVTATAPLVLQQQRLSAARA